MEAPRGLTQVEKMIGHAIRAGAFRAAARKFPDAAETFQAAASINSAKAHALANEIAKTGRWRVRSSRR